MSAEGRGGAQVKFSDKLDWRCSRPIARVYLESVPFVGEVAGETPLARHMVETRRRDVGKQMYGTGIPVTNHSHVDRYGLLERKRTSQSEMMPTSHGNLRLSSTEPDLGFLPTADAIFFLRSEYLGSRQSDPPARYFP